MAGNALRERPDGAWSGQLLRWRPRADGPNVATAMEREDARARSRELIRTDPIAGGAISTNVSHVVGTGLSMRPAIKAKALKLTDEQASEWEDDVAERWEMWSSSPNASANGRLDFYSLQDIALRSMLSSGDVFAFLPEVDVPGWPYRLTVQMIEADRVSNPDRKQDIPGELVAGVVLDSLSRPIGYHVSDQHPGSVVQLKWSRQDAVGASGRRRMLHLFETTRPDQVRGVPYLTPVIGKLKDLSRYSEAELSAAITNAALALFVRMDPEAFERLWDDESKDQLAEISSGWDGTINPNTATRLGPGEDIVVPDSKRPSANFDPFFQAVVRQIGVGLELPFEVLIKHFTASYSASRAALLDAWRVFRRRRDWLSKYFCQPIYEEWLADEIASGRVSAPGFFSDPFRRYAYTRAQWIGDGPGSIDPNKEVDAAKARVDMGISTIEAESILHDGVDWTTKHKQRELEVKMRREAGLEEDPMAIAEMNAKAQQANGQNMPAKNTGNPPPPPMPAPAPAPAPAQ